MPLADGGKVDDLYCLQVSCCLAIALIERADSKDYGARKVEFMDATRTATDIDGYNIIRSV